MFEAHTLVIASLRQTVEQKDDGVPRKVPQAERAARMEQLKLTLSGINITGDFEPGHAVLDKGCNMFQIHRAGSLHHQSGRSAWSHKGQDAGF